MAWRLFPLPFVGVPSALRGAASVCRKVRRRIFCRNVLLQLARQAISALNRCAGASLGGRSTPLPRRYPVDQFDELQSGALGRVLQCSRNAGLLPRRPTREALCELLKVDDLDCDLDSTSVVPFSWDKLKLLRGDWQVEPKNVLDIAPDHVARHFRRSGQFRLSHEEADFVGGSGTITPYWDPRLGNDAKLRRKFMQTLVRKKLVTLRRRVHSFVGLFFVRKRTATSDWYWTVVQPMLDTVFHHTLLSALSAPGVMWIYLD